jgi:glycosyltransferase involved in cell wall biosynthesis
VTSGALVSIVIPAYNAATWLATTLESAIAQTWRTIEIIVVDDGSADGTADVAQQYGSHGVKIVRQTNRGLSAARNTGLGNSRGDYIQFLDADDLLSPEKIEHQVALLQQSAPRTLATARWARFRLDPSRALFPSSPLWRDLAPLEYLAHVARTGNAIPVHAWLLPRGIVDAVGPFSEELHLMEDHEYFARAVLASAGLRFSGKGCAYYRSFHGQSLSKDRQSRGSTAMFRSVELATTHILAQGSSPELRRIAADYFQWVIYKLYPTRPDLIRRAEQRVSELGGSKVQPQMGREARVLARIFGWRAVLRLRSWLWSKGIYLSKRDFVSD